MGTFFANEPNYYYSLIGSLRKRVKPDTPLIFNWELFWENTNGFYEIKTPLIGRQWNGNIYKIAKQLWLPTIRCLLFCDLSNIFLLNLQIVFISLYLLVGNFFDKNCPKILRFYKKFIFSKIMGVVFKSPRFSIGGVVRDIWRCNTATSFSFGVLSPSGELQTKKWSQ